jgi:hypothetical protein
MTPSIRSNVLFALLVLSALLLDPAKSAADTPQDYLVQQVCDDGFGGATSADPITCPGSARKLRIGERLPYHKYNMPKSPLAQISDSFPIADLYERTRVVQSFFFTTYSYVPRFDGAAAFTGNSSFDYAAQVGTTGYDMAIADGNYVSYAGTYDGGRGWQPFWANSQCAIGDTWLIAPKNAPIPMSEGNITSTLNISSPQCPPNSNFSPSLTVWNFYNNVPYQSGKSLNSIKTWHFSGPTLDSDAIEVFYHTKEYGKSRWEAWRSAHSVSGPSSVALARCGIGTNNGVNVFGATTYYLVDCHDWTFIYPAEGGGWDPVTNWHVDPHYNSINLLKNTHMQCTDASGRAADCGYGGSCTVTAPWQLLGSISWAFNEQLMGATRSANCSMRLTTYAAPNGQSVYQDVSSLPAEYSAYTFGVALWRPENIEAPQTAEVVVFEVNAAGQIVGRHSVTANVTRQRRFFSGSFVKSPQTQWVRFQVYVNTPNRPLEISDAWIAPDPYA